MKKYHTLLIKENGEWFAESGHYSKADCKADKECHYGKKTKIITTDDSQEAINTAIAKLNGANK